MWIKCGDELNTCLKRVHQIFWPWKKFAKYLYFSNSIFTMMGAPEKKVILRFFSRHEVIYLWVKFQVSLTCPTGFLPTNTTFFTNIWREYFFPNILRVFDQPEVEFSKSGQNWANTRPLLLKTFESSNCVDRHIVQWRIFPPFLELVKLFFELQYFQLHWRPGWWWWCRWWWWLWWQWRWWLWWWW